MTVLDTLITDRTQEDVDLYLELNEKGYDNMLPNEREKWDANLKGAYDYRDMNRVREAIEYIDHLMLDAKRQSVYQPVMIPHKVPVNFDGQGMVTEWNQWTDKVWIDYDLPTPAQWAAHLANIDRLWTAARRFEAVVLNRYDPNGNGYIKPDTPLNMGNLATVTDSVGLMELRVTAVCPPSITAGGVGWTVVPTVNGWKAVYEYPGGPHPDVNDALAALKIFCRADDVIDAEFTLSALLRYNYLVTAGTCAVKWSPFILWSDARTQYGTWGGAKPLTWGQAGRGQDNG